MVACRNFEGNLRMNRLASLSLVAIAWVIAWAVTHGPADAADGPLVTLQVRPDGSVDFDHEHFTDLSKLQSKLAKLCAENPKPNVNFKAANGIEFEKVGRVVAAAQGAHCLRVGFLTQPPPN